MQRTYYSWHPHGIEETICLHMLPKTCHRESLRHHLGSRSQQTTVSAKVHLLLCTRENMHA